MYDITQDEKWQKYIRCIYELDFAVIFFSKILPADFIGLFHTTGPCTPWKQQKTRG